MADKQFRVSITQRVLDQLRGWATLANDLQLRESYIDDLKNLSHLLKSVPESWATRFSIGMLQSWSFTVDSRNTSGFFTRSTSALRMFSSGKSNSAPTVTWGKRSRIECEF